MTGVGAQSCRSNFLPLDFSLLTVVLRTWDWDTPAMKNLRVPVHWGADLHAGTSFKIFNTQRWRAKDCLVITRGMKVSPGGDDRSGGGVLFTFAENRFDVFTFWPRREGVELAPGDACDGYGKLTPFRFIPIGRVSAL